MNKATERLIQKIYTEVFKKIYNRSQLAKLAKGSRVSIMNAATLLENSKAYEEFAKKYAAELAKKGLAKSRGVWRKYFQAAQKLHYVALPMTYREFEFQAFSKAVKQNFTMIKSIPRETVKLLEHKYMSTLIEEVAKGALTRGAFRRQLESHAVKNAKLIARTESAKLQTAITREKATDVGSVAYIWLASNDKRTRPSHKAMDGVVVFWRQEGQKPLLDNMRGDAGEFPNCRCSPQPIVDTDDLTKSVYKVYNYSTDSVISMNKSELIKALEKGSLN